MDHQNYTEKFFKLLNPKKFVKWAKTPTKAEAKNQRVLWKIKNKQTARGSKHVSRK